LTELFGQIEEKWIYDRQPSVEETFQVIFDRRVGQKHFSEQIDRKGSPNLAGLDEKDWTGVEKDWHVWLKRNG
jgi:hypothetical protein